MIIDTIPNVTVSSIQAHNSNIMAMGDTTMSSSTSSDQEPTDMLHALHHDEKELRILAVVLSLTGGLVLSFLLGVGIFVYWHWRAWRTRRRKKFLKSKRQQSSVKTVTRELSSSSIRPSMSSSPIPSPSSSTSSLAFTSHSEASSLAIEAVTSNGIDTRQREDPSSCAPSNPITSSSISSSSTVSSITASQKVLPSPTAAATSIISTSPSATSTPVPSNVSVHSRNNYIDTNSQTISNISSDITKRDMMNNDSAIYQPSPIITNYRAECSSMSISSIHHNSARPPMIPPVLLDPAPSSAPIPTAPPAKECIDSPSPSSSIPLPSQGIPNGSSFDPPDIPPPAYSPN